jgi:Domain of unknown function (DUF6134)
MRKVTQLCAGLLLTGLLGSSFAAADGEPIEQGRWNFNVFLDDKKVGTHRFELFENGDSMQLQSEANFKYKFLFVTAYTYEHRADEVWANNCLRELNATTNANGKRSKVSGGVADQGFVLDADDDELELPKCIMTFAYWNPDFLDQQRLLNPQTGEYLEVSVEKVGGETIEVRGAPMLAKRFKLTAAGIDVTLWYSTNDEWLALESVAKGGRILRYELS